LRRGRPALQAALSTLLQSVGRHGSAVVWLRRPAQRMGATSGQPALTGAQVQHSGPAPVAARTRTCHGESHTEPGQPGLGKLLVQQGTSHAHADTAWLKNLRNQARLHGLPGGGYRWHRTPALSRARVAGRPRSTARRWTAPLAACKPADKMMPQSLQPLSVLEARPSLAHSALHGPPWRRGSRTDLHSSYDSLDSLAAGSQQATATRSGRRAGSGFKRGVREPPCHARLDSCVAALAYAIRQPTSAHVVLTTACPLFPATARYTAPPPRRPRARSHTRGQARRLRPPRLTCTWWARSWAARASSSPCSSAAGSSSTTPPRAGRCSEARSWCGGRVAEGAGGRTP
jgi:hypothetical protein